MGRNRGFTATLIQVQREAERQRRARSAAELRSHREVQQLRKQYERTRERAEKAQAQERKQLEKDQRELYLQARMAEVDEANDLLAFQVAELEGLLGATLELDDYLDFEVLKEAAPLPEFAPGGLAQPSLAPLPDAFRAQEPKGLGARLPGVRARFLREWEQGRIAYESATEDWRRQEDERRRLLTAAEQQHRGEVAVAEARLAEQHAEIEKLRESFQARVPAAVIEYFGYVLERSIYPEAFPQEFRLAYVPESRQLVLEYELPPYDVVPTVSAYKYVKTGNKITETARTATQRKQLYQAVIAQVAVRTLHELFESDRHDVIETIVLNGHVETTDAATGRTVRPCLVSVSTSRATFLDRDFARLDPVACLIDLSANLSKSPSELLPVRPLLEFSMVDPRFVEEADVLSGLDQRQNLMALSPREFEVLITNLFTRMGLEARTTRASRDGGVDCVAFDDRPIFGGKVVIQAKRYKNTVEVGAVRDLFGSVHNEGATKGILVTTSGYGKASFEFVKDKPLELLSGSNLIYLLKTHAGLDAKIEPPEHWVDPERDIGAVQWDDAPPNANG